MIDFGPGSPMQDARFGLDQRYESIPAALQGSGKSAQVCGAVVRRHPPPPAPGLVRRFHGLVCHVRVSDANRGQHRSGGWIAVLDHAGLQPAVVVEPLSAHVGNHAPP